MKSRTSIAGLLLVAATSTPCAAQAEPEPLLNLRFAPTSTLGLMQPGGQSSDDALTLDEPPLPERIREAPWRVTMYWENDGQYFKPNDPTDEQYTNGTAFSAAGPAPLADDIGSWMPFSDHFDDPQYRLGFIIALQIFTPDDLSTTAPITDDRPYAGYLYVGSWWQRSDERTMDRIELNFGTTGPASGAEGAQKWIHDVIGDPEPMGWDNQIGNELQFDAKVQRKWRFNLYEADRDFAVQIIPNAALTLGTAHRNVGGDVTLRAGWGIPDDFGPSRLAEPSVPVDTWRDDFGIYGFVRVGGAWVQHDVMLDGNNFRDSLSIDKEPLVGELQAGVVIRVYRYFEFGYSQTFLTPQFKGQGDGHSYGAYTFGLSIPF